MDIYLYIYIYIYIYMYTHVYICMSSLYFYMGANKHYLSCIFWATSFNIYGICLEPITSGVYPHYLCELVGDQTIHSGSMAF